MAWTYDASKLATNTTYQVRLIIGDTIATDPQLQDEEIAFHLTRRATSYGAAAECCRSLASQFSRKADSTQGQLHTFYSSIASRYAARAQEFEAKSALNGAGAPYAGGISVTDKQEVEADTDRVTPQFNLGIDDNSLPVSSAGNETLNSTGTDPLTNGV